MSRWKSALREGRRGCHASSSLCGTCLEGSPSRRAGSLKGARDTDSTHESHTTHTDSTHVVRIVNTSMIKHDVYEPCATLAMGQWDSPQ